MESIGQEKIIKDVDTFDVNISENNKQEIEAYLNKKRNELHWSDKRIINHVYHYLLTRAAYYRKRKAHVVTKKHLNNQCVHREPLKDEVKLIKKKLDFRIKVLAYLSKIK